MSSIRAWAEQNFGGARLGDQRRSRRLVQMAQQAALAPAGHVTQVFRAPAQRQAAYDFLEHDQVPVRAVGDALFEATARACQRECRVMIALDGTSLTLTDYAVAKGFGHIGNISKGSRGLKLMNAVAVSESGVPIGVAEQGWWSRSERARKTACRPAGQRESVHWRHAVAAIGARFAEHAPNTKLHFLADREADATLLLRQLLQLGHEFTIRSNGTRNVQVRSERRPLREVMGRQRVLARLVVEVSATYRREARKAHLDIRAARLPIVLRDKRGDRKRSVTELTVIWAHERRCGYGVTPLDWVLLTNARVVSAADACAAVRRYSHRWRIEDFHRTWKSGLCSVEQSQLRSTNAVIKWATILAAVASRAERLRHRYRDEPEAPASVEFTDDELEAISFLANENRPAPLVRARDLRLAESIRLIANLGGYVGNRGSGPPGAVTIARGLERVLFTAGILARLRDEGRLR